MPTPAEPSVPLAQARARWGDAVVMAGLFRPGPDPQAKTALRKAVSRRTNRRRSSLPARVLVALDDDGRALVCAITADPQGGHPTGDDLFVGPFEELGAVPAGELNVVVLLDDDWVAVLEAVWLDRDAATVAALLTGEPLPDEDEALLEAAGDGESRTDYDDDEPSPEALLAEADAMQARANSLRALVAMRREDEEGSGPGRP